MRLVLECGRRIAVHRTTTRTAWVPAEERVVVFCHSGPGAGIFDPDPAATQASNVRLLSVDRPGYGSSQQLADGACPSAASSADDLAAVLDSLGVERVGVVGWSSGGRVALALAARRPDLVERLVVVAAGAPDKQVPSLAPGQQDPLDPLRRLPPGRALTELCERLTPLIPEDPWSLEGLRLLGADSADEAALRANGVRERLGAMLQAAFAQGARGLAGDIAAYCLRPWGFEPERVRAETLLLYGSRDSIADPRHGHWWKSRLPNARLEIVPGAGHLLVVPLWSRVLSHLAPECVEELSAA
jgi:pimeloyl-ACP methyl ester carboxylesterase